MKDFQDQIIQGTFVAEKLRDYTADKPEESA